MDVDGWNYVDKKFNYEQYETKDITSFFTKNNLNNLNMFFFATGILGASQRERRDPRTSHSGCCDVRG